MKRGAMAGLGLSLGLLLAGLAQAAPLSEEQLVRQLQARGAATDGREDPDAVFGAGSAGSARQLSRVRAPDTRGACTPPEPAGGARRSLAVIALAPPDAPQVLLSLQFELASYRLTPADQGQLDVVARAMNRAELQDGRFTVSGHTDASGDAATNDRLSCARALAARAHLIERGVAEQRLAAYGFGSARPLQAGRAELAENRRIEIRRAED